MNTFRSHIEKAVSLRGSQVKLATAAGCSQQYISLLLQGKANISAEKAIDFEAATGGAVSRHDLRPDIFGPSTRESA